MKKLHYFLKIMHLHCNACSLKDASCNQFFNETIKTRKGDSFSFSFLNGSKILQRDFWKFSDTEKTPEHCITSLSLLKIVVIGDLVESTNYDHQVMHENVMKLLHLEMGEKFTLTINTFLHRANNGVGKQMIKFYDRISVSQAKWQHKKLQKQLI